jgi:hypothetical protein
LSLLASGCAHCNELCNASSPVMLACVTARS